MPLKIKRIIDPLAKKKDEDKAAHSMVTVNYNNSYGDLTWGTRS